MDKFKRKRDGIDDKDARDIWTDINRFDAKATSSHKNAPPKKKKPNLPMKDVCQSSSHTTSDADKELERYRKLAQVDDDSDDSDDDDSKKSSSETEFQMFIAPTDTEDNDFAETPSSFHGNTQKDSNKSINLDMVNKSWRRKECDFKSVLFDEKGHQRPIHVQQMFSDYTIGVNNTNVNPDGEKKCPIVRFYGCTDGGHSVLCNVYGYVPYFYIKQNPSHQIVDLTAFKEILESKLRSDVRIREECENMVLKIEEKEAIDIMHYQFNEKSKYIAIYVAFPMIVNPLRKLLESGLYVDAINNSTQEKEWVLQKYNTYESNVLFVLRCMVDSSIVGSGWIQLNKYTLHQDDDPEDENAIKKTSHCQIECSLHYKDIITMKTTVDEDWDKIAPLRILSYDIECSNTGGHFPTPQQDAVIMIANYISIQGESSPIIKNVFVLGSCAKITGAEVITFDTEEEMLKAWRDFVIQVDPDILTGYNVENFDMPYLINRALHLSVRGFNQLGRLKHSYSNVKLTTLSSKQLGSREIKQVNIHGRVTLDIMPAVKLDYKFSSYTLNYVSGHFLGEQKEDVHHSMITKLFKGTENDRRRLAVYCLKDAYLPQRLMDKLMFLVNYIEMARVTGIPISFILEKGQQIKVMSQLLRAARAKGYLIPTLLVKHIIDYKGAKVFDPIKGYYTRPIATLDFASLYPSIMIANNLCYSSLIRPEDLHKLDSDQYIRTPYGSYFMKTEHHQGLLTIILRDLLAQRKIAKNDMKNTTDPMKKMVFDGRQKALKVSANSVYGFTGAQVGMLPCLDISASVTGIGQEMITLTQETVEGHYCKAKGFPFDSVVIYGDTDSVMVDFGVKTIKEAMDLGLEAAGMISKLFKPPIKLEFEKVFARYLLLAKKRYCGLKFELGDDLNGKGKLTSAGLETKRRDNCQLVRTMLDNILKMCIQDGKIKESEEYTKNVIRDLLSNKIDIQMLIITKSISKPIKSYDGKYAHIELAKKKASRDPAMAPRTGDRIPYVYIRSDRKAKAYEKVEDPVYVLENGLQLDFRHYLDKQLLKPLMRIYKHMTDAPEKLVCGEHTRFISNPVPTNKTGILKFTKVIPTCLNCRCSLQTTGDEEASTNLCVACKPKMVDIYTRMLNDKNHIEKLYSRAWTHCQRCQGSVIQDVICNNNDCSLFYMRIKTRIDLEQLTAKLNRFNIW